VQSTPTQNANRILHGRPAMAVYPGTPDFAVWFSRCGGPSVLASTSGACSKGAERVGLGVRMEIDWRPGIGDPTLVGWLTVVMYFVASGASLWAARCSQSQASSWRPDRFIWLSVGALCLALGINKQLDLQSLFTEIARDIAKRDGWYDDRHKLQEVFIASIILAMACVSVFFGVGLRRSSRLVQTAAVGVCFVAAFVVIRAASFHRVDLFLGETLLYARWNWILELTGIFVVIGSAIGFIFRSKLRAARE